MQFIYNFPFFIRYICQQHVLCLCTYIPIYVYIYNILFNIIKNDYIIYIIFIWIYT